jgi:hypothetical protein
MGTALKIGLFAIFSLGISGSIFNLSLGQFWRGYSGTIFLDTFDYPSGLVTNEYAYRNSVDPLAKRSRTWELTSGSLFSVGRTGYTGLPDGRSTDRFSEVGNNSAVFRLTTIRDDFENVVVEFALLNEGLSSTTKTAAVEWDGVHVFLRYQSQYNLYYASVNRRDNTAVIKKKIPGGPSNDGTYYDLSSYVRHVVPYRKWQQVRSFVWNNRDGSVSVNLFVDGMLVVSARDDGSIGGPPIRKPGKVGIRGDNAELYFDNFKVTSLP